MSDERENMTTAIYTHDEHGIRQDVHRPSAINPGDYEYVKVDEARKARVEGQTKLAGPAGTCHHCGKAIIWRVHFKHVPTGNLVTFGYQCAEILKMTDNRIDHEMNLLKRRAANERREEQWAQETEDRRHKFMTEHADVYKFVMEYDDDFAQDYINRYKWGIEKYGSPLDWQIDKIREFMQKREDYLARRVQETAKLASAAELVEGRQHIEGTILSIKYVESVYGTTQKMLVQLDDGNKVFGSVPASIHDVEKGDRVSFDATIQPKEDHFAFYSRPAKAVKK